MPLSSVPFVIEFPFVLGRPALLPDPWTTAPDACVLEARRRFEAAGFVAGLTPAQQALGPMHGLTQVLVDAFSGSAPGGPRSATAPRSRDGST
jgi:hypothetical protein